METNYKERPILFSGEMVRAILDGRKHMTRRVIKPQFSKTWGQGVRNQDPDYFSVHVDIREPNGEWRWLRCPYGKKGDRLWVKETWAAIWPDLDPVPLRECNIEYRADSNAPYPGEWPADEARANPDAPKWRPSIYMPRWASRLTLEVTGVKVERVQDISDEDAMAEGVYEWYKQMQLPHEGWSYWSPVHGSGAANKFRQLWDSINGSRPGCAWQDNPFVWCVSFRRVGEGDQ
jgi:hypothetical protein